MKTLLLGFVGVAGLLVCGPALAQSDDSGADTLDTPAALRCSALAEVDPAQLPVAIAFLAGYGQASRDATTFATVGGSTEAGGEDAPASPEGSGGAAQGQQPGTGGDAQQAAGGEAQPAATGDAAAAPTPQQRQGQGGPSAAVIPAIPVETIAAACAQSPDSRVLDIITAQGSTNAQ